MREMREVFGETLVQLGRENDKIVVLDADLNTSTKTDLFKHELPSRFIQVGIAEQNMFGWAAGLATFGFIPFPTTFAVFAAKRACDQISISIAYPRLNVKIPGCYSGVSAGKAGATHQAIEDIAIMRAMPNMTVLSPADNTELEQVMRAIVDYDGPVYFRVLRVSVPDVMPSDYRFNWKPVLLRNGKDVAIMTTGFMTHKGMEAAELLVKVGIEAAVVHVPCLKPLESELIVETAEKCGAVVTAEDHSVIGGLGDAVASVLAECHPVPMRRIGVRDTFVETGDDADIWVKYGLTAEDVAGAAIDVINEKP